MAIYCLKSGLNIFHLLDLLIFDNNNPHVQVFMKISMAIAPELSAGLENISRAISQYLLKSKACRVKGTTMPHLEVCFKRIRSTSTLI